MSGVLQPPQRSLPLFNPSAPPATRAECAAIPRPCNRYSCPHHLWPNAERAGRKHGVNEGELRTTVAENVLPDGVAEAIAEGRQDSCALDEADKFANETIESGKRDERPFEEIAALLPKPKKKRQGAKAQTKPELTKERVRQIAERGLNKQWAALSLVKAFSDFHSEFTAQGGAVDFLWGVIVDEEQNMLQRRNDATRVWITIGLDCSKVNRPHAVEKKLGAGVAVRKKVQQ